ncbi:hypothetical protein [Geodermatophilus obscurus]|uniref:hypothetical protein n=1 Tax=Geodermatophilus obscurus TaxID=1861 RepID=UPI0009328C47|nr:hypothetical protein [Geodermatophilus obscurus]
MVWVVRALYVFLTRGSDFTGLDLDRRCSGMGISCGALTGFVLPWLSVALATAIFLFRRLRKVPKSRQQDATTKPHKLVPTAGSSTGKVVGRDELCKVLIDNVHTGRDRRPQLIVGGVGTGKTAVIVHLVELLAKKGATPIAIRMRDVPRNFSFRELACQQFQWQISGGLLSSGEGDKIWRYLGKDDRLVVLADGLEEALPADEDRDDHIRLAITQARKESLPLIITSRPHDSLRGMDASILELESLSEEAALQYLSSDDGHIDPRRVDWIVETAGVTEAPLYLRIAHDLNAERLLSHLITDDESVSTLNTRNMDRSALRRNLLDTWRSALISGRLRGELPLTTEQRTATMAYISALACVGLLNDQLEVKYEKALKIVRKKKDRTRVKADPEGRARETSPADGSAAPEPTGPPQDPAPRSDSASVAQQHQAHQSGGQPREPMVATIAPPRGSNGEPGSGEPARIDRFQIEALSSWLNAAVPAAERLRGEVNTRLAAAWGTQLGLVEVRGEGVRFQHSVLQAYLGSRPLASLLEDRTLLGHAFQAPERPGRELLIALVLLSRGQTGAPVAGEGHGGTNEELVRLLLHQAEQRSDSKALDILAAAVEIDALIPVSLEPGRRLHLLAQRAADKWPTFGGSDLRTLEEAKLGFVYRFGEALREVDQRIRTHPRRTELTEEKSILQAAYGEMFRIGYVEASSYPVRHAVAQELGVGGTTAFDALSGQFEATLDALSSGAWQSHENWRKSIMSAWLAPLLYAPSSDHSTGSASHPEGTSGHTPEENLRKWIGRVGRPELRTDRRREGWTGGNSLTPVEEEAPTERAVQRTADDWRPPAPALPISIEVALAQGFKYAANRRAQHSRAHGEVRTYLAEHAVELLRRSGFWFSQMTLVQALGLWALPDLSEGAGRRVPGPSTRGVRQSDVRARVRRWVEIAGDLRDEGREPRDQGNAPSTHRFVVEAGELVIKALEAGRPERFMWIDEHGVTSKIGASAISRAELRKHALWIPPSIGWSALDRSAQQLVADVLLLLHLADRGDNARLREERLSRANRRDLPLCLASDRSPLDPNRKIGVAGGSQPGKNCPGDCEFDLCPYPPKGHVNYHAELTETFCRRQQTLLDHSPRRRTASWQEMPRPHLRRFWGEMGRRARR